MDDDLIYGLVRGGFSVALRALDLYANRADHRTSKIEALGQELVRTTDSLSAAITSAAQYVVDKIESDKMDELRARLTNVALLHRNPDRAATVALQYALTLNESVYYAERRVAEGKIEWVGLLVAGRASVLTALDLAGSSTQEDHDNFAVLLAASKEFVLNTYASRMIQAGGAIPWAKAIAFLVDNDLSIFEWMDVNMSSKSSAPPCPHGTSELDAKARDAAIQQSGTVGMTARDVAEKIDRLLAMRWTDKLKARPGIPEAEKVRIRAAELLHAIGAKGQ